ncbi:MAG: dihydroorotate dehydrogenase [Spirochaetota bacterium]
MKTSAKFLKLSLKNRSVLASGILGVTLASLKRVYNEGAGLVTTKSVGPEKREGHTAPVIFDWGYGLINSVGLSNPGIENFVKQFDNDLVDFPLVISIFGKREEDFPALTQKLKPLRFSFLELNLSCPNVLDEYGTPFSFSTESTYRITRAVKDLSATPVIVKLSPNTPELLRVALSAQEAGADALCIMNTLGPGMVIDISTASPVLGNISGGLSGEAILPITVKNVYEVSREVEIPIIGVGGIDSPEAALQVLMAGAAMYGIGSAVYRKGLGIFKTIDDGIRKFMDKNGIENSEELVGLAHRRKPHAFYHFRNLKDFRTYFKSPVSSKDIPDIILPQFFVLPVHQVEKVTGSPVRTIIFHLRDQKNISITGKPLEIDLTPAPGQFYMLWIPEVDQKPYSVSYYDGEFIGFSVVERGRFSSVLFSARAGEPIGILGPLGRGFDLSCDNYLLAGGGIGSAPLVFASLELMRFGKNFHFLAGGKTSDSVSWIKPLLYRGGCPSDRLTLCTEDGSAGLSGMVTEQLDQAVCECKPELVLLCGPEIFIKKAMEILKSRGVRGEASIERMMKCGVGICGSCCIDPTGERVCIEGPVFTIEHLEKLTEFGRYRRDSSGSKVRID